MVADPVEMFVRRNCASILLATETAKSTALEKPAAAADSGGGRNYLLPLDLMMFKCKDCNRRFPTFQALGGHRASHMKLRLTNEEAAHAIAAHGGEGGGIAAAPPRPARFKIHECRECRIKFPTGQALGGHMRKHAELKSKRKRAEVKVENLVEAPTEVCNETFQDMEESNKRRRVVLELDLNSLPQEDDCLLQLALVN